MYISLQLKVPKNDTLQTEPRRRLHGSSEGRLPPRRCAFALLILQFLHLGKHDGALAEL